MTRSLLATLFATSLSAVPLAAQLPLVRASREDSLAVERAALGQPFRRMLLKYAEWGGEIPDVRVISSLLAEQERTDLVRALRDSSRSTSGAQNAEYQLSTTVVFKTATDATVRVHVRIPSAKCPEHRWTIGVLKIKGQWRSNVMTRNMLGECANKEP